VNSFLFLLIYYCSRNFRVVPEIMFCNPYETQFDFYYPVRAENSFIRILHASPNAPPVDVYSDNKLIARNLAYRNFTQYLPVSAGTYNIKVFPAGQTANPVISTSLNIPVRSILTVAAIGMLPNISLLPIPEPAIESAPGMVQVRFAHLSPNTPAVDVTLPDGTILFRNVKYNEVTKYIPLNAGTYTLEARPAGTTQVVLYVPNIVLLPNRFYTFYAVGLAGGNPALQLLIPIDGNSYIKFY